VSIAKSFTCQLVGLTADLVSVEVDVSHGLHSFSIVGLGDRAVEEAKDRISAAIKNSGFVSPKQKNQKVVISLAPADTRKEGSSFDLAMAIAYQKAVGDIPFIPQHFIFLGELSLEGHVRKVSGLLPMLIQAPSLGFKAAFIPRENTAEASLARGIDIYPVSTLIEVVQFLSGELKLQPLVARQFSEELATVQSYDDMSVIKGNETAKRGLEIAAAGAHNVLMCGPPGTGKTLLARSFASILPPLSYEHAVEVTGIHSAAKVLTQPLVCHPPFRAPHHTASYQAVVGGGAIPKPGEITLAHRGVLFLDELPEFDRTVIEALRQPLEEMAITISRAKASVTFPAHCILIASMNPCPCGKGKDKGCECPERIVEAYYRRISGPIMDRIDVHLDVSKVDYKKMAQNFGEESSETIRKRVIQAREFQKNRFGKVFKNKCCFNSEMTARDIEQFVLMENIARDVLTSSAEKLELSGRAFHRIIKIAQTIADLHAKHVIQKNHVLEALQYRQKKQVTSK